MERGLVLRQHFFGADSEEVWRACKTVGEMCNLLAMTYLQQGACASRVACRVARHASLCRRHALTRPFARAPCAEDFAMVLELLKKADILTERDPPGRAVTYNNLACYYRRQGKLHAALSYLQKSLKIEAGLSRDEVENPADTHLNMCAVLSQLGRHQTALEHAQSALILLQEELFGCVAVTSHCYAVCNTKVVPCLTVCSSAFLFERAEACRLAARHLRRRIVWRCWPSRTTTLAWSRSS